MIGILALLIAPAAQASQAPPRETPEFVVPFSTTPSFDAGTKSNTTQLLDFFAANGVSQPSHWVSYPSAAYANGATYAVYQGVNSAGSSQYASPWIARWNGTAWSGPVRIADGTNINDDHGSPSILFDKNGRIHVFYGAHAKPILEAISTNPYDISAWNASISISDRMTYPHPFLMSNGTIYLLARESFSDNTYAWISIMFSKDNGATWSAPRRIIDFSTLPTYKTGIYMGGSDQNNSALHIAFTYDNNTLSGNRFNSYEAYYNVSNQKLYCEPSLLQTIPLTFAAANANCLIENTGAGQADTGIVHLNATGDPSVIYTAQVAGTWKYRFSQWTGAAWTVPSSIMDAPGIRAYADFIEASSSNLTAYFTVKGVEPATWRGGNIEKWTWNGAAWAKVVTVLSDQYSAHPLASPTVPRNSTAQLQVVFNEINVDNYTTAGAGLLKSYGWTGSAFALANVSGLTHRIETATDNPAVPSSAFSAEGANGDAFPISSRNAFTTKWHTVRWISGTDGGNDLADINYSKPGRLYAQLLTGNGGTDSYGVSSNSVFTGDFNITVSPFRDPTTDSSVRAIVAVFNEDVASYSSSGTVDGIYYEQFWQSPAQSRRLFDYTVTNGVPTQIGTTPSISDVDFTMRIVRTGTAIKWWYSSNGVTFTLDHSATFSFSGNLHLIIAVTGNSGGRATRWSFDDLTMSTVSWASSDAFQTTAGWLSASQATTPYYFVNISVSYSGASASRYISSRGLMDSVGTYFYINNTHLTAGSSSLAAVPVLTDIHAWRVFVNLTGDGTGSVLVSSVSVGIDRPAMITPALTTETTRIGENYGRKFTGTDADGDALIWSFKSDNAFLLFGSANHTVFGIPSVVGVFYVNISVNDGYVRTTDNYTLFVAAQGVPATFDANAMTLIVFLILVFVLALAGFALDIPALTMIGGVAGFIFTFWLFTQTAQVPLMLIMGGVSAMFFLMGIVWALGEA